MMLITTRGLNLPKASVISDHFMTEKPTRPEQVRVSSMVAVPHGVELVIEDTTYTIPWSSIQWADLGPKPKGKGK